MQQTSLHPMLNVAIKAARAAGGLINRASLDLEALRINTKSPNDFVTEVDHACEGVIIETLLGACSRPSSTTRPATTCSTPPRAAAPS